MSSLYDSITQYFYPPTPPTIDPIPNLPTEVETSPPTKVKPTQLKLGLTKFDMKRIQNGESVLINGKRSVGKSVIINDYLKHHDQFSTGLIVAPCEGINPELVDPSWIQEDLTPAIMTTFAETCATSNSGIIILDDYGAEIQQNLTLSNSIINNRPTNASLVVTQQYPMTFNKKVRDAFDWVFLCREANLSTQRKLFEQHGSVFTTFAMFQAMLNDYTRDYGCLVIHKASQSSELQDSVFWYCAEL